MIDLVSVLGFKKSRKHEDELSKESDSMLGEGDSVSEIMSESAISKYAPTSLAHASLNIDEDGISLASKILEAKAVEKKEQE